MNSLSRFLENWFTERSWENSILGRKLATYEQITPEDARKRYGDIKITGNRLLFTKTNDTWINDVFTRYPRFGSGTLFFGDLIKNDHVRITHVSYEGKESGDVRHYFDITYNWYEYNKKIEAFQSND